MRNRITIALVLGAAAATTTAAILFTGDDPITVDSVLARRSAALPAPLAAHRPILELGAEHRYEVSLAQLVNLDATKSAPFRISLTGTWAVAYAGSDERGERFRAQLRDARPEVKRGEVDVTAALGSSLGQQFYFTTTPEGRLLSLSFTHELDELTRGALATLAATFQVSSSAMPAWDALESDGVGDYRAQYTRAGDGLHRDRLRYEHVTAGSSISATVVTTGTDLTLRADGWPAQLGGHEVTRVGTQEVGAVVDTTFSLRHAGLERGVAAEVPDGLVTVAIGAVAPAARATAEEDRDMVDGATLADLLAGLGAITDEHARGYQFLRIAALMRLDPDAVRAAQRLVLDGKVTAEQRGILIGAFGEAGTPVAQRALGDLLATPALGEEARTHAAISLGLTQAPTPDTLRALEAAAAGQGDIASSATLAQGNAALRMQDEDPAAAAAQLDALLARLARATDDEERALVLRAIGNTGDARALGAIERALAGGSIAVRIAATEALRLMPGVAADRLVAGRFEDTSALVRNAAVFAASERDLTAFATTFARAVRRDPDVDVRRAIVQLAASRLGEIQGLRAVIEHVAAHDADQELRAAARAALAG